MKRLIVTAALCCASIAHAGLVSGFSGSFSVPNWTSSPGTGSISTAPDAVSLTSGDDNALAPDPAFTSFYIWFSTDATVSFSWDYLSTDDDPFLDSFGFVLADTEAGLPIGFGQLTVDGGPLAQSGSSTVVVSAGQYFGFAIQSDNFGGPATATVSGLRFDVPEPGALALLAAALAAAAATTRRRRAA